MIAAIACPVGVPVSTPSRKARNVIRRSPRSAMVRGNLSDGPTEPVDRGDHDGVTGPARRSH
jgi:hypothetical protein